MQLGECIKECSESKLFVDLLLGNLISPFFGVLQSINGEVVNFWRFAFIFFKLSAPSLGKVWKVYGAYLSDSLDTTLSFPKITLFTLKILLTAAN